MRRVGFCFLWYSQKNQLKNEPDIILNLLFEIFFTNSLT